MPFTRFVSVNAYEIGFLENGRRSVRFETLLCLAEALEVPVTGLFERGAQGDDSAR